MGKSIEGAYFVVEPFAGPIASKINVFVEEQSIIAMGTHFTQYCGLVARAYVRTMHLNPYASGMNGDVQIIKAALGDRPDLIRYWLAIFLSFAATGTHILAPFKPCSPFEIIEMEQMAYAMEVFALAHEAGHHILRHGKDLQATESVHDQEFAADALAVKICEKINPTKPFGIQDGIGLDNPFLKTGAGGVLLMKSLAIFRAVKSRMYRQDASDGHPDHSERIRRIMHRSVIAPEKYAFELEFCSSANNVLQAVEEILIPAIQHKSLDDLFFDLPLDWEQQRI